MDESRQLEDNIQDQETKTKGEITLDNDPMLRFPRRSRRKKSIGGILKKCSKEKGLGVVLSKNVLTDRQEGSLEVLPPEEVSGFINLKSSRSERDALLGDLKQAINAKKTSHIEENEVFDKSKSELLGTTTTDKKSSKATYKETDFNQRKTRNRQDPRNKKANHDKRQQSNIANKERKKRVPNEKNSVRRFIDDMAEADSATSSGSDSDGSSIQGFIDDSEIEVNTYEISCKFLHDHFSANRKDRETIKRKRIDSKSPVIKDKVRNGKSKKDNIKRSTCKIDTVPNNDKNYTGFYISSQKENDAKSFKEIRNENTSIALSNTKPSLDIDDGISLSDEETNSVVKKKWQFQKFRSNNIQHFSCSNEDYYLQMIEKPEICKSKQSLLATTSHEKYAEAMITFQKSHIK